MCKRLIPILCSASPALIAAYINAEGLLCRNWIQYTLDPNLQSYVLQLQHPPASRPTLFHASKEEPAKNNASRHQSLASLQIANSSPSTSPYSFPGPDKSITRARLIAHAKKTPSLLLDNGLKR